MDHIFVGTGGSDRHFSHTASCLRFSTCFITNSSVLLEWRDTKRVVREYGENGKKEKGRKTQEQVDSDRIEILLSSLLNKTHVLLSLFSPLPSLPFHILNFRKI